MGVVASWIAMMLAPLAPAAPSDPEIGCYAVEAHVLRDGQEIAAPTVRVATGGLSTIVDTDTGFAMLASVTPRNKRFAVEFGGELYLAKNNLWQMAAKPVIRTDLEQLAEQRFDDHGAAPLTMQIRITKVASFNAVAARYLRMTATPTVSIAWKITVGSPVSAALRLLGPKMEGC